MLIVQVFPSGPFSTNAYVVACRKTGCAAIIDAPLGCLDKILDYLKQSQLQTKQLLITHSHWDHIAEVAALKKALSLEVSIHPLDINNLREPGIDGLPLWIPIDKVEPDHLFKEGEVVHIGDLSFKIIHTPGHTPGGVCFYNEEENVLFSGDTLFKGSIGNLSFPTSQPEAMWASLSKLAELPSSTKVYPGHGLSTTIGGESWLRQAKEVFGK